MEYKSKEVKAGMFIALGFLTLAVFVFMLGDVKNILDERKNLTIIFDYTSGLQVGATVRYAGLDVGRGLHISSIAGVLEEGRPLIRALPCEPCPSLTAHTHTTVASLFVATRIDWATKLRASS